MACLGFSIQSGCPRGVAGTSPLRYWHVPRPLVSIGPSETWRDAGALGMGVERISVGSRIHYCRSVGDADWIRSSTLDSSWVLQFGRGLGFQAMRPRFHFE